ncbi:hypothetical protein RRSWK_04624 [Rhodopirellula sp. SWK7]|nr:hypothetical protein RRSWK_04624 [Rhodopirellula sp. SWK7]
MEINTDVIERIRLSTADGFSYRLSRAKAYRWPNQTTVCSNSQIQRSRVVRIGKIERIESEWLASTLS